MSSEVSHDRIARIEDDVTVIFNKQSEHSEALAKVGAVVDSVAGNLELLVDKTNTKEPSNLTNWIVIAIASLGVLGSLSFAFLSPVSSRAEHNTDNLAAFRKEHNERDIVTAEKRGAAIAKAEAVKERVIATESAVKSNDVEISNIKERLGGYGVSQEAMNKYLRQLGERQYGMMCGNNALTIN